MLVVDIYILAYEYCAKNCINTAIIIIKFAEVFNINKNVFENLNYACGNLLTEYLLYFD